MDVADSRSETRGLVGFWTDVDDLWIYTRGALNPIPRGCEPVVLVHGLGIASRYLVPTAVRLAPDFDVYAPDLPGFGRSSKPPRALDVPRLADLLAEWMGRLGLTQAAFFGNSFGCQVVASLAVRHPGLVGALILSDPTGDPHRRSLPALFLGLLLSALHEPLSLSLMTARAWWRVGLWRMVQTLRFMRRYDLEPVLPRIQAPALVVRGQYDAIATQRWVERVAGLLPRGRGVIVIPGAGHAPNYGAAARLVAAIRPFLNETCLPRAPRNETA